MKDLSEFKPRPLPGDATLSGRLVTLQPYDPDKHGLGLAKAVGGAENEDIWTFMPIDPFPAGEDFIPAFKAVAIDRGWSPYVIISSETQEILGTASYMRQRPEHGSCEVGCLAYNDRLKRTAHATEAMYLMASHVFDDLGYRRYEWKCHNENGASRRAAERLGFQFEGVFRNDIVMKGQNRDTAWLAMIDDEWPIIKTAFESWLTPDNFDEHGHQKRRLESFRA